LYGVGSIDLNRQINVVKEVVLWPSV